ncbi:deoxycytidylate deaminase-like isoform X3 [Haliotis rufescens]|uniref:deoxycytidylate deaminase-like isoform X3 n=1 Tax=Haliotis rufescens TaxID=6454 RepID=UPI00201EA2A7|nr:deoxycytidylate deaminase-like isoform X3 [Haliotis rufescens]
MASQNPKEKTSCENAKNEKRIGYIGWEEYFMAVAQLSSLRSKDPSTQVGACIVNKDKRIVGTGYNGMPDRCSDDELPWGKGEGLDNKKPYVCHAELNAILNRFSANLKDCKIFVTLFPCNHCTQMIIQSGIHKVVYLSDEKKEKDEVKVSKILLRMAGVKYRPYRGKMDPIKIQFAPGPTDDGGKMDPIKVQFSVCNTDVRGKMDPIKLHCPPGSTDVRGKMDLIKLHCPPGSTDVHGKMEPIKEQLPPGPTDCQRWNGYLNSNLIKKCFFHLVNEGNMFT